MTDLIQLIYSSKPFGFDDAALNGILSIARWNNPREANVPTIFIPAS